MQPVRVLILTQWFDPEPTFKGLAFARGLKEKGFDVEVLTGFPNYPGGKIYSGYKVRPMQREIIDGITVTRVPLYASHDQSALRRVFNYISFFVSATIGGLFLVKRPDVIYAYHPPLTVGVAAVLIRFFRRSRLIYDIQDMWPDTLRATGMLSNEKILSIVGRVCSFVYRHVDVITVLSPGFKRLLIERGVPEKKIELIYNWCDEGALVSPSDAVVPFLGDERFCVLFAGNMGRAQALDTVIDAAVLVAERSDSIVFRFIGGGLDVDRLKRVAEEKQCRNVEFLPAVAMNKVGAYLRRADALLVHLKKDPLFEITIPSKTQAYMAIGRPLLMGVGGDAANLVDDAGCGRIFGSEDPQSLADAVLNLAALSPSERQAMGHRGLDFYRNKLSFKVGVARFAQLLTKLSRG